MWRWKLVLNSRSWLTFWSLLVINLICTASCNIEQLRFIIAYLCVQKQSRNKHRLFPFLRLVFVMEVTEFCVRHEMDLGRFRKIAKSFVMSVCLSFLAFAWNNSAPTERICMELDFETFFEKSVENSQVLLKPDKTNWHFTCGAVCTAMAKSRTVLIMRNVSNRSCRENQNTLFVQ